MHLLRVGDTKGDAHRWLAVLMIFVFVQGGSSTFLHFETEPHYFCIEHYRFTHDAEHAREARRDDRVPTTERPSDVPEPPSRKDDHRESRDCLWLTWLQHSSYATPDLTPRLLNLPPPIEVATRSKLRDISISRPPIALQHVSPINSPPAASDVQRLDVRIDLS